MKAQTWLLVPILLGSVATLPACALLAKSPPLAPRYFTPELDSSEPRPMDHPPTAYRLRLGRIQAGAHLRQRMAYRTSGAELGYYEDRRWTERPEAYLRRALSRSLFEGRGISRAMSGPAPTLDAELVSFEEIKNGQHRARVQVVISLDDARTTSIERTITVEREVEDTGSPDPNPVVQALAHSLAAAVQQIRDIVVEHLAQLPPPATDISTKDPSLPAQEP